MRGGQASRRCPRAAERCMRCRAIQGRTWRLSHLHWKGIPPCDLVLRQQASLPTSSLGRKPPLTAGWTDPVAASSRLPAHPALPAPWCLGLLSHLVPCASGLCLAGTWAGIGNAAQRGDGLTPSDRTLSLLTVARADARCRGPCMGRSCRHGQTQLPVCSPGLPWDMNICTSEGRARMLAVSLELLGGGQIHVACTLRAGRLQRLFGGLGLGHWQP